MSFDTTAGTRGGRQPGGFVFRWGNQLMAGRVRKGRAKFLGFNALVLTTVGRQLADRGLGGRGEGESGLVLQPRRPSRPGPDRDRRPEGPGDRRAAPRRRARAGLAADHHRLAPVRSVPGQDRPGAADHPPDPALRRGGPARLRPVPSASRPGRTVRQFSLSGRQAGSRPVNPMSLSSSGAVWGTVTGGPNSPGLPPGFCATAD